jgi:hypothetical protein
MSELCTNQGLHSLHTFMVEHIKKAENHSLYAFMMYPGWDCARVAIGLEIN